MEKEVKLSERPTEEIAAMYKKFVQKLRKAKLALALGALENPNMVNFYKKEIARIRTVLRDKTA